jgi:signal peptidase I
MMKPNNTHPKLRVLRLTLKRKWYDMIASGEKREEYRTPGKWILSRMIGKDYDLIEFKNGYGANVPSMIVEYKGYYYGQGITKWGAIEGEEYLVFKIGRVLSVKNISTKQP